MLRLVALAATPCPSCQGCLSNIERPLPKDLWRLCYEQHLAFRRRRAAPDHA